MGISVISKASCDPGSLPIGTWLSPHPLDRESPFEVECLKGLPGFDISPLGEDGVPPLFREHNINLFNRFQERVGNDFREAMRHMWSLLDGYVFTSITVLIDYANLLDTSGSIAGYNAEYSAPQRGKYIFNIAGGYLHDILLQFDTGQPGNDKYLYTWEHEIVHMVDHWEMIKAGAFRETNGSQSRFIQYLLGFRTEGVAELYCFLRRGIGRVKSITEAKRLFEDRLQEVHQFCKSTSELTSSQIRPVETSYDFYDLGPWIILDLLKTFEGRWHEDRVTEIILQLECGEVMSHEQALIITKIALRMKTDIYLSLLTDYFPNF